MSFKTLYSAHKPNTCNYASLLLLKGWARTQNQYKKKRWLKGNQYSELQQIATAGSPFLSHKGFQMRLIILYLLVGIPSSLSQG